MVGSRDRAGTQRNDSKLLKTRAPPVVVVTQVAIRSSTNTIHAFRALSIIHAIQYLGCSSTPTRLFSFQTPISLMFVRSNYHKESTIPSGLWILSMPVLHSSSSMTGEKSWLRDCHGQTHLRIWSAFSRLVRWWHGISQHTRSHTHGSTIWSTEVV